MQMNIVHSNYEIMLHYTKEHFNSDWICWNLNGVALYVYAIITVNLKRVSVRFCQSKNQLFDAFSNHKIIT